MSSAKRAIGLRRSRLALRRVAGAVVLMLFAHQTTASAWIACDGHGSERSPAGDATMLHGHHGSTHGQPAHTPAPSRDSSCDHSVPGTGCCMVAGCAVAVVGAPLLTVAPRPIRPFAIPAPTESFLSPDVAPDVPPPRA